MSAFADLLDRLIALKARERAAGDAAKAVKAKAEVMAIERHAEEGARTWDRPDGGVSIVQPSPRFDVVDSDALVDWLDEGTSDLVLEEPVIVDPGAVVAVIRSILAQSAGRNACSVGRRRTLMTRHAADLQRLLVECIEVHRHPAADWHEHVDVCHPGDKSPPGRYPVSTPDGEVVPGVEYVVSSPSGIQVRPAKALVEREGLTLAGGV